MSDQDPIPYEDIHSLKTSLNSLQSALEQLKEATLEDARNGYDAIVHLLPEDAMHPEERRYHPWQESLFEGWDYPIHQQALIGITDIWFHDQASPKRTISYPGMLFCSINTLKAVRNVNQSKIEFKENVLTLKAKYRDLLDRDIEEFIHREGEWNSIANVKKAFSTAGLSRICIKQVYRLIPVIATLGLKRAKYYHNPKRPSRPRTVEKQLERFQKLVKKGEGTQDILYAIEQLSQMNPSQLISERQDANEVITVNYKMPSQDTKNGSKWLQHTGVLPIYCLGEPNKPISGFVDFKSLDTSYDERQEKITNPKKKKQIARNNSKENDPISWSDKPFLPAFRLYLPSEDS